jgi:hypothetical protein
MLKSINAGDPRKHTQGTLYLFIGGAVQVFGVSKKWG